MIAAFFDAYKEIFESLEAKGDKPKMNVMDNQATNYIKQYLTKKKCDLQVVEPHNHHVNAAERAIQTFKDAFIAALATTDCKFLLQLWDKLALQVQNTLNLLRSSRINPNKLAYEALNGYNCDCYPLAPPGCKAVIYKAPGVRGSWASKGTDAWYLGPSVDHYQCNIYYVPEMQAYGISGSAKLFPQHCQLPNLSNNAHLKALTEELQTSTGMALQTHKGQKLIKCLRKALDDIFTPQTIVEQRVTKSIEVPPVENEDPLPITQISDTPAIMQMHDPTTRCNLSKTKCTHQ
jgi:hypothetical protein